LFHEDDQDAQAINLIILGGSRISCAACGFGTLHAAFLSERFMRLSLKKAAQKKAAHAAMFSAAWQEIQASRTASWSLVSRIDSFGPLRREKSVRTKRTMRTKSPAFG
jgi:hypothetical protein